MLSTQVAPTAYAVAVDHGSLEARRIPRRGGTRYFVSLRGAIDERWAALFRWLRVREPDTCGFDLDRYGRTISFLGDEDDPRRVRATLATLDSLVALINETSAAMDIR